MTRVTMALTLLCGSSVVACAGGLPTRYVIERDLGAYHFRRYQKTLESDLPIAGNQALGHSAAYMRRAGQTVEVVSVLVTVYEHPERLTEALRTQLSGLPGYELSTQTIAAQYAWQLRADAEPTYWVWPSGRYLVKLAAPAGQSLPEAIVEPYAQLYPSDLDQHGHALPGAASGGNELDDTEDERLEPAPSAPSQAAAQGPLAEAGRAR